MTLPQDIINLILQFHDIYNVIGRKRRLNNIITHGYNNWLLDCGLFSRFYQINEYECKKEIFPFTGGKLFVSNVTKWKSFIMYFHRTEYYNKECFIDFVLLT